MKRFASIFVALGLATAGSTALAEQTPVNGGKPMAKPQPVQMTDAQMDRVAAGQLIEVQVNNNDVRVNLPIQANVLANVNAAVAVLGPAGAGQVLGNQTQRNFR